MIRLSSAPGIVIDASVAVKWVAQEPHWEKAVALLNGPARHAPAHYLAEACTVLWAKAQIRRELSREDAAVCVDALVGIPVSQTELVVLIPEAWLLSAELGITIYDTLYLALALKLGAPLVTADRKLFERARGRADLASLVVWLGDIAA